MITLVKKGNKYLLTVSQDVVTAKGYQSVQLKLSWKQIAKLFCLVSAIVCKVINKK